MMTLGEQMQPLIKWLARPSAKYNTLKSLDQRVFLGCLGWLIA